MCPTNKGQSFILFADLDNDSNLICHEKGGFDIRGYEDCNWFTCKCT